MVTIIYFILQSTSLNQKILGVFYNNLTFYNIVKFSTLKLVQLVEILYGREPNLASKVDALSLFKYKAPLLLVINPTRDSLYNNTISIIIRLAVQTISY